MMEFEYNKNPTEIQEGDEIEESFQFCGKCYETITQPILKGIWYHNSEQSYYDHTPVLANTFLQLFLMYVNHRNGKMLKIGKYDDKEDLACSCYVKWYNLLKKNIIEGFQGMHYFDTNGISTCGVYLMQLQPYDITESDFPEKQGYSCKSCMGELIRKKKIKIIEPTGKNKNEIYNKIVWLKNTKN